MTEITVKLKDELIKIYGELFIKNFIEKQVEQLNFNCAADKIEEQMTLPKEVSDSSELDTNDEVATIVEDNSAIFKPGKGNILDIGGSIKVSEREKPIDFEKVRREVTEKIAWNAAEE
ncbi:MAG: hypothetical protein KAW12_04530 [Candidatus Aminicenantes bacterium]|nr:hypothetical protein [Candidatus Aminicenantes bacterium]